MFRCLDGIAMRSSFSFEEDLSKDAKHECLWSPFDLRIEFVAPVGAKK